MSRLAVLAVLALAPAITCAQEAPTPEQIASRLAAYMDAEVHARGFHGAVLVARDGKDLLRQGYGLAHEELNVPNTAEMKFRLGSITKPFTAMAVLLLRDQGKLALDDPIGKHLKDAPEAWKDVTIRNLLNHSSGIPSFTGFPDYRDRMRQPTTVKQLIDRFRDKPLDFKPGDRFDYSNSGYAVLGALIEEVSGKTYEDFLKQSILEPLDLRDTGYDHPDRFLALRANGHDRGPDGIPRNAPFLDMSIPFSAGALYSTVDDLKKLDTALTEGKLLSSENYAEMIKPFKGSYALGWMVPERHGRPTVGHNGGINGFSTAFHRYPEDHFVVIVLSNLEGDVDQIALNLAAIALGKEVTPPEKRTEIALPTETLDRYVGRYRLLPEMTLEIRREGDHLVGQPSGQPPAQLYAETETLFFLKVVDATVEFVAEAAAPATELILRQGGQTIHAPRIDPEEKPE